MHSYRNKLINALRIELDTLLTAVGQKEAFALTNIVLNTARKLVEEDARINTLESNLEAEIDAIASLKGNA